MCSFTSAEDQKTLPGGLIWKVMGIAKNQVPINALVPVFRQRGRLKIPVRVARRKNRLNEIGITLFVESDTLKLLELIAMGVKSLANTEGGSLYILMMVQARIMAIADIFEALTASDRPCNKGKKLSECLQVMGLM